MTSAEKVKKFRAGKKAAGLKRFEVWVPQEVQDALADLAKHKPHGYATSQEVDLMSSVPSPMDGDGRGHGSDKCST